MSKALSILVSVLVMFFHSGCSRLSKNNREITKENIKVGFVYNGFINDEGYTQVHDEGRKALNKMGIPTMYIENVKDDDMYCHEIIDDMIEEGCNVIYAISYGFMNAVVKAAEDHPNVIFGHCSGTVNLPNLSTYFGKMYQARYLAGIVAGMKTKSSKVGYVAAYEIPECIRGVNAFALGVLSVNPDAKVYVYWTSTWNDPLKEKKGAQTLIEKGCDVIEQHQDTPAAQLVAQDSGAFCLGYNFAPEKPVAPNAYLCAPIFHWEKFIIEDVNAILDGVWESRSYWEGLDKGIVDLSPLSDLCTEEMEKKVFRAKNRIINGNLKIFSGKLYDTDGNLRVPENTVMSDDEIMNMDWFIKDVIIIKSGK